MGFDGCRGRGGGASHASDKGGCHLSLGSAILHHLVSFAHIFFFFLFSGVFILVDCLNPSEVLSFLTIYRSFSHIHDT